mgnify:CR=1 FL=1
MSSSEDGKAGPGVHITGLGGVGEAGMARIKNKILQAIDDETDDVAGQCTEGPGGQGGPFYVKFWDDDGGSGDHGGPW